MDGPVKLNDPRIVELQGVEDLEKPLLVDRARDVGDPEGNSTHPSGRGCQLVFGGQPAFFDRDPFSKPYIWLGGWEVGFAFKHLELVVIAEGSLYYFFLGSIG